MERKDQDLLFTPKQVGLVYKIAHNRNDPKVRAGFPSETYSGETSLRTHILGAYGEVGVAIYYNLPMPMEFFMRGDDGTDFNMEDFTLEVKTRNVSWYDYILPFSNPEDLKADYGVLAYLISEGEHTSVVRLHGVASRDTIINAGYLKDVGNKEGRRWLLERKFFLHMDRLK